MFIYPRIKISSDPIIYRISLYVRAHTKYKNMSSDLSTVYRDIKKDKLIQQSMYLHIHLLENLKTSKITLYRNPHIQRTHYLLDAQRMFHWPTETTLLVFELARITYGVYQAHVHTPPEMLYHPFSCLHNGRSVNIRRIGALR